MRRRSPENSTVKFGRRFATSRDPWTSFIFSFELPVAGDAVASPLSLLLTGTAESDYLLDGLGGAHPAVVHASTWCEYWNSVDHLCAQVDEYGAAVRAGGARQETAFREIAIAVRNWLSAAGRHVEQVKKVTNAQIVGSNRKSGDISAALQPLWNPISRAVGAIKHGAADVLPIHYESSQSGDVSGFFISAPLAAKMNGPVPSVHPGGGAWSFNRVVPVVSCGILWADRVAASRMIQTSLGARSRARYCSPVEVASVRLRRLERFGRWVFPDERSLPYARLRSTKTGYEFLVGTQLLQRPTFPSRVRWHTLLGSVDKGFSYDMPYWPRFEPNKHLE